MRITHLIASMAESGGAEMLVRNLLLAFARDGHECHLLYISDAASLGVSSDYERAFKAELDVAGISYSMLGHACKANPVKGGWRLARAIRRINPDVLHIHLGYGLLFVVLGLIRKPTVYTHHNVVFKFPTWLFRVFDLFVDRYVGICDICAHLLQRLVTRPIVVIRNGVPDKFATPNANQRLDGGEIRLLAVGNLTLQKDYPTLIKAFSILVLKLAQSGRSASLQIAGEGTERELLEAMIAEHGLTQNVRLLGTRRDIVQLMAGADLQVMSSVHEGLPISLIEAARSGLPAVVTDVGGNREIIRDGVNGLLVPAQNPAAMADKIERMIDEPLFYAKASQAAVEIGDEYDLGLCCRKHLDLYREIIPGAP